MDEIEKKTDPNEKEREKELKASGDQALAHSAPESPVVNRAETIATKLSSVDPKKNGGQNNRERYQRFCRWLRRPSATEWLTAIFTGILLWVAWWQTDLISKSNEISRDAAAAANDASTTAKEALEWTKAGEATTQKIVDSLQGISDANEAVKNIAEESLAVSQAGTVTAADIAKSLKGTSEATTKAADAGYLAAKATKDVAAENAKTAAATKYIAATAERALSVSNSASKYAGRAASAAENSIISARETSIQDMRAYMSVIGTDLRYDQPRNQLVATITIENTGRTPAHNVRLGWTVNCTPRSGLATPLLDEPSLPPSAQHSVGPRAKIAFKQRWNLQNVTPQMITDGTMDMWIYGRVEFDDEFTRDLHFTNFRFTQGPQIPGSNTTRWELVFAQFGNNSDRPTDRLVRQGPELEETKPARKRTIPQFED